MRDAIDACLASGAALPGALGRGDLEVLRDVARGALPWSFDLYEKAALVPRLASSVDAASLRFADVLEAIDDWHGGAPWPFTFALDDAEAAALGYTATSAGIERARRKHQKAWWAHEKRARSFIVEAAKRCPRTRRAVVLGVGMGSDLPLEELAKRFDTLELVEVDRGALDRTVSRRLKRAANLVLRTGDVTGINVELDRRGASGDPLAPVLESYRLAGPPALTEPGADLVISSMLLSQLIEGVGRGLRDHAPRAWAQLTHRVQHDHVRGLLACADAAVLISDVAEQATALGPDGKATAASPPRPMIGAPKLVERVPSAAFVASADAWSWRRRPPTKRGELGSTLAIEALQVTRAAR